MWVLCQIELNLPRPVCNDFVKIDNKKQHKLCVLVLMQKDSRKKNMKRGEQLGVATVTGLLE